MNHEQAINALIPTFQNGGRSFAECKAMARDYIKQQLGNINVHCQGCGKVHTVPKTWEIPPKADHLGCNWCPDCESTANDYYQEWIVYTGPRRKKRESLVIERRFPQQTQMTF